MGNGQISWRFLAPMSVAPRSRQWRWTQRGSAWAHSCALEKNVTIANLNLGDNEIGAEGAARIAEALEKNSAGVRCVVLHPKDKESKVYTITVPWGAAAPPDPPSNCFEFLRNS